MAWNPPTLADDEGREPGELVRCRCGREVQAQMMMRPPAAVDLDNIIRGRARGGGPPHICDGCRERLVREGHVARAELVRHLGAPADVLTKLETRGK